MSDTDINSASPYPVYVGVWVNWSRGFVLGSTLTLGRREAEFLIAFTAFFIAYVASRFWRVTCFIFHRYFSTPNPRDAIYHQQQAILRNSSSPEDGIRLLAYLLWRGFRSKNPFRPLPALTAATICVIFFTVAGGFSSTISTAVGNEVLIQSKNCGYVNEGSGKTPEELFPLLSYGADKYNAAANYAQQCYSNSTSELLDCGRFITQQISGTVDGNAACPFSSEICRNSKTNLRLDTGYVDSHSQFGLNSPPHQRILFRNVLHCAPLATEGFTTQDNTSLGDVTKYHYGSSRNSAGDTDYVYLAKSLKSQYEIDYTWRNMNLQLTPTKVIVKNRAPFLAGSNFIPIEAIARPDADVHLFFLSGNGVYFQEPTTDDWYRTQTTATNVSFFSFGIQNAPNAQPLYVPLEPASPLGCTDQYQFCNTAYPGTSGCGPLASIRDAIAGAGPFFGSSYADFAKLTTSGFESVSNKTESASRFLYFVGTLFSIDRSIGSIIGQLGPTGLSSQKSLLGGYQYGTLPWNQWHLDVNHWWGISLALTQSMFIDTAYGPSDPALLPLHINFTAPELKELCSNQKIQSTTYASFSVFGLLFTIVVGILIILVSYLLEPVSAFLHRTGGYNQHAYLEWTTNSTLQLQRLAHEATGLGTWSRCTSVVPATEPNELLGCLDVENLRHPVLYRSLPMEARGQLDGNSARTLTNQAPSLEADKTPSSYGEKLEIESKANFIG
ncbi:hypothetical protein F5Y19DRAFT_376735 [Xylariaceae sp. FL1651]|nr:hypothetical protein F5Y19DRAFT_376735 [Xylariaceae sp. FL1651]